ncbi:MAG: hypothetical protein GX799_10605 [Crenarchaeota archaeon]|jgi:hypothetical protein|nr:hypothetical protein [Thermoproteota archaeon]
MRKAYALLLAIVALGIILGTVIVSSEMPSVPSTGSTEQSKALAFIENVLPIDSSQYNITFRPPFSSNLSNPDGLKIIGTESLIETYSLESKDSSLTFICSFYEEALYQCQLGADKGLIITDQSYANTVDAAKDFLKKYQAYSNLDSTEMIAMLANADPTQNPTIISGDLKLTVTHKDLTGTAFGDSINFRWVHITNGCEYLLIDAHFKDGVFSGFIDHRPRYTIGDTAVNISKDQAITIALEAIKNYSYRMSDDWVVTGFNVTENKITANLIPTVKEGNVLYPAWSVTLPLNGTWPGSVTELLVGIWAGSGEVYFVHYQAYAQLNPKPALT